VKLQKLANKKHSLTNNPMQKLDFFLAEMQIKAIVKNEHQFDDNELENMLQNYSRIVETKVKVK